MTREEAPNRNRISWLAGERRAAASRPALADPLRNAIGCCCTRVCYPSLEINLLPRPTYRHLYPSCSLLQLTTAPLTCLPLLGLPHGPLLLFSPIAKRHAPCHAAHVMWSVFALGSQLCPVSPDAATASKSSTLTTLMVAAEEEKQRCRAHQSAAPLAPSHSSRHSSRRSTAEVAWGRCIAAPVVKRVQSLSAVERSPHTLNCLPHALHTHSAHSPVCCMPCSTRTSLGSGQALRGEAGSMPASCKGEGAGRKDDERC